MYRSGKGLWASMRYSGPGEDGVDRGPGSYFALAFEPSTAGATGYATGAGVVATEPGPGMVDLRKPWIVFTHRTGTSNTVACHTVVNLEQGSYILVDTAPLSGAVIDVPCDDGVNSSFQLLWLRTAPLQQFAFTFPFGGGAAQPQGNAMVHMLDGDAYFAACGDVTGCRLADSFQSFWRVYDANITLEHL